MHAVVLRLDQLLWAKRRACSLSLRAELPEHGARTPCADAEPRARLKPRQHAGERVSALHAVNPFRSRFKPGSLIAQGLNAVIPGLLFHVGAPINGRTAPSGGAPPCPAAAACACIIAMRSCSFC